MQNLPATFCRCIAESLSDNGVNYHEFCQARGYREFKIDLDQMRDDALEIASTALAELCIGDRGPMDKSVLEAVLLFVQECNYTIGTNELTVLAHDLRAVFPAGRSVYRSVLIKWIR